MQSECLEFWNIIKKLNAVGLENSEAWEQLNVTVLKYSDEYKEKLQWLYENLKNDCCEEKLKEWKEFAREICALKLAVELQSEIKVEKELLEEIEKFYETTDIELPIRAFGIYGAGNVQKAINPTKAYDLQLRAFRMYPQLGQILGSSYIYNDEIEENYYDECPICGNKESEDYYCVPQIKKLSADSVFSPVKLWRKCTKCHNLFAYNFPVNKMGEINGHYTKAAADEVIEPRYSLRIYSDIFNKCREYTKGKKYLEIGIGNGEMLAAALEMGYEAEAVEICKEDCEKVSAALGIDVKWSDFLEYKTEKKYDVIIMGDVLEHIAKPIEALEKVSELLNEGGLLWLSTPNYNSSFTRLKKFSDPMWNQLNHFTYFSYETLLPFLEKLNFNVVRYDISNRFRGSMELFCVKE